MEPKCISIACDISPVPSVKREEAPAPKSTGKGTDFKLNVIRDLKEKKLAQYVENHKKMPKQGTGAWLSGRRAYIGGSDMASVIGKSPYDSYIQWLRNKLGLKHGPTTVPMLYGKIFEQVTTKIMKVAFGMRRVHEIPCINGPNDYIRYSPDGAGVVTLACEDDAEDSSVTIAPMIALFEFKSPMCAIPTGSVPEHYLPQVKTGLCSMGPAELGLFVNCMYRKCPFNKILDHDSYDRQFYKTDAKRLPNGTPALSARGIIYVYGRITELSEEERALIPTAEESPSDKKELLPGVDYIDYGCTGAPFEEFLRKYVAGEYKAVVDEPELVPEGFAEIELIKAQLEQKTAWNLAHGLPAPYLPIGTTLRLNIKKRSVDLSPGKKYEFLGILPWKLFSCDILYVEKDEHYLDEYAAHIEHVGSILKRAVNATHEEKLKIYAEEYERVCV